MTAHLPPPFFNFAGDSRAAKARMGRSFLAAAIEAAIVDSMHVTGRDRAFCARALAGLMGIRPILLGRMRKGMPVSIGTGETVCDALGVDHSFAGIEWWGRGDG